MAAASSAVHAGDDLGYRATPLSGTQLTRPTTVAYSLSDSPVGQLAWIVEKFKDWADADTVPEDAVDRDLMLALVSTYWFTNTGASSAQLYYDSAPQLPINQTIGQFPPVHVPLGSSIFPHAPLLGSRTLAERDFNVISWTEHDEGGNFAAMERPGAFVADIRAFTQALLRP